VSRLGAGTGPALFLSAQVAGIPNGRGKQVAQIPDDFPVRPLGIGAHLTGPHVATCGACGRSWDDSIVTAHTPAPAARCPFEAWHEPTPETRTVTFTVREWDTLRAALDDATYYRLGNAYGIDDPELDVADRHYLLRYEAFCVALGIEREG
jgi:hypothetical protein